MRKLFFTTRALILLMLIASAFKVNAGIYPSYNVVKSTTGNPLVVGSTFSVIWTAPFSGSSTDLSVKNAVGFGVDQSKASQLIPNLVAGNTYEVDLQIKRYGSSGNQLSPFIVTKKMIVKYNPLNNTTNSYLDKADYVGAGAYKLDITIQAIIMTPPSNIAINLTNLPIGLYIDGQILVNRVYDFTTFALNPISNILATPYNIDCDNSNNGLGTYDELEVTWPAVPQAESYQLEWTYVNDYPDPLSGNITPLSPSILSYDFRNNSTRISTNNTSHRITMIFERGYLLYRVRAMGRNLNNIIITGTWSLTDQGTSVPTSQGVSTQGLVFYVDANNVHQQDLNWQYSSTFAEEGKKKEVVNYFDGSLRNRQSVTKVNSDNNVIVGETIYDNQGRPAINVLPTPVNKPVCTITGNGPAIKYYPDYNLEDGSTTVPYSRNDFDFDIPGNPCNSNATGMNNTTSGSSNYYSSNNPDKNNQQAYVPDAFKYPFSQVIYTPDNTGRIRSQGGVGPNFQINTNHETKYFYGQPNQLELDRLFGSEAGDAAHYKKNLVVDANGQGSSTYLDEEGRTIATCLAGPPVVDQSTGSFSLKPLPSFANSTVTYTVDAFSKNTLGVSTTNTVNVTQDAIVFTTQLLVTNTSGYHFDYNMHVDTMADACLASNICFNCIYNLEIKITDDCGNYVLTDPHAIPLPNPNINPIVKKIGKFTPGTPITFNTFCTTGSSLTTDAESFVMNLNVGNYTVSKILSIDTAARNFYIKAFLDSANNTCFKTLHQFQHQALSNVNTSACAINCAQCKQSLGDRDDWVSNGNGTYLQYDFLFENCDAPCKPKTLCDVNYQLMLGDVSPGGQYGEYLITGNVINPSAYPLSVFNTANLIPHTNAGSLLPNWRNPHLILNGTDYYMYLDGNGNRNTVVLQQSGANYFPAVLSTSSNAVFFDNTTNHYYTYPENLLNFSDFQHIWTSSYARSLVIYHPEYCYYKVCSEFGAQETNENLSSDQFDENLKTTNTFNDAVSHGYFVSGYQSQSVNNRLVNFFSATDPAHDPYMTSTAYQSFAVSPIINSTMQNLFTNYKVIGSQTLSMPMYAALLVRCGSMANTSSIISTACTDFGAPATTSVLDNEWNTFKSIYLSEKNKVQEAIEDYFVNKTCYGANNCIGTANFNSSGSGLNSFQPCSNPTLVPLFSNKTQVFIHTQTLITQTGGNSNNNGAYQSYLGSGQCPNALDLQSLLTALAANGKLTTTTNEDLTTYVNFSNDMYTMCNGNPPGFNNAPLVHYYYVAGNSTGNILSASINDPGTNLPLITFSFDKTAVATQLVNWTDVTGLSQLNQTGQAGTVFSFKINAISVDINHNLHYHTIDGTTNMDIKNCFFAPVCNPNDLAVDINNILTAMATNSTLLSTSPVAIPAAFATSRIIAACGASQNNLFWKYGGSGSKFLIYDATTPANFLIIKFNTFNPTSFTNLSLIKTFTSINSNYQNFFTITGVDASGNQIVIIDGELDKISGSITSGPILGDCGLPTPLACIGNTYKTVTDLQNLLNDLLTQQPFNGNNIVLANSTLLSNLLVSYLPASMLNTPAVYTNNTSTLPYNEELDFVTSTCTLTVKHKGNFGQILKFANLVKVDNLTGIPPSDNNGNYNGFYCLGHYIVGGAPYQDTIFGLSCIPLTNCSPCNTGQRQQGGNSAVSNINLSQSQLDSIGLASGIMTKDSIQLAYAKYVTAVKSMNTRLALTPSDSNYVTPVLLTTFYTQGLVNTVDVYSSFLKDFNPALDSQALASSITKYAIVSSNILSPTVQFDRYKSAVDIYNIAAVSVSGAGPLQVMSDSAFYNSLISDSINIYIGYLNAFPQPNKTPMDPIVLLDSIRKVPPIASATDTCTILYRQYVVAYQAFSSYIKMHPGHCGEINPPMYTINDFINNNYCCSNGLTFFNHYIQSFADTINCPRPINLIEGCTNPVPDNKECQSEALNYLQDISSYNASPYAIAHHHFLYPNLFSSFSNFVQAGYCNCLLDYLKYLSQYINAPANSPLPIPVDISNFQLCKDVQQPACDQMFGWLNATITNFNSSPWAAQNAITMSLPFSSYNALLATGACHCISGYVAYLNTYSTASATAVLPTPINITNFCNQNPNSGGGGIPTGTITIPPGGPGGLGGPGWVGTPGGSTGSGTGFPSQCTFSYNDYILAVQSYNNYVTQNLSLGYPSITNVYTQTYFTTSGYCYCLPQYKAFIQAVITGIITDLTYINNNLYISQVCGVNNASPCPPSTTLQDTVVSPLVSNPSNPCVQQMINNALQNAQNSYNHYIDSLTAAFTNKYTQHCLGAFESFIYSDTSKEYHFTLYYYDQAGNLVRTVPPEGIVPMNIASYLDPDEVKVNYDRTFKARTIFTQHVLTTTYDYNSLNQLIKQSMPDHDNMVIFDFTLPNGLNSKLITTAIQFVSANKGYLSGYVDLTSTPYNTQRSYLYTTVDGGLNWTRMNDILASNLKKIQMASATVGYAVGDDGMIIKTIDGGVTWDLMPITYNLPVTVKFNDLFFVPNQGIVVGENGTALYIKSIAGAWPNLSVKLLTGFAPTDHLTSVNYSLASGLVYISGYDVNGVGFIYSGNPSPPNNNLAFTKVSNIQLFHNLNKVRFITDATTGLKTDEGYAVGEQGMLLRTTNGGTSWNVMPTNIGMGTMRDVYFKTTGQGVALIDSIDITNHVISGYPKLYMTIDTGKTWTHLGPEKKYYYAMHFFEHNKGVVVGREAKVTRIVANTLNVAPYFALIPLNSPPVINPLTTIFTGVASADLNVGNGPQAAIVVTSAGSDCWYTKNGLSPVASWTLMTSASANGASMRVDYDNALPQKNAYVRAVLNVGTGLLCFADKFVTNSGVVGSIIGLPNLPSSQNFIEINNNLNDGFFYALNNGTGNTRGIYQISVTTSSITPVANCTTAFVSPVGSTALFGAVPNSTSFDFNGSKRVAVVGSGGQAASSTPVNTITPTALIWSNNKFNMNPVRLNDIHVNQTPNQEVTIAGINGDIVACGNTPNGDWQILKTGAIIDNFNEHKLSGLPNIGLAAGEGGVLYRTTFVFSTVPTVSTSIAFVPLTSPVTSTLRDISFYNTKSAAIVGDNGTLLYIPDITLAPSPSTTVKALAPTNPVNFLGVTTVTSGSQDVLVVGDMSSMFHYVGLSGYKNNEIFIPQLNDVHFIDNLNGYITGNYGTIRHTANAGASWKAVFPEVVNTTTHIVPDYQGIWTTKIDNAVVIGNYNYIGNISNGTLTHFSVYISPTNTQTWYDVAMGPNNGSEIFTVGDHTKWGRFNLNNSGNITSQNILESMTVPPAITSGSVKINALHVFRDNSFMVVGENRKIWYHNNVLLNSAAALLDIPYDPHWRIVSPTTNASANTDFDNVVPFPPNTTIPANTEFKDIYFHDDRQGYAVGTNGVFIKYVAQQDIQVLAGQGSLDAVPSAGIYLWTEKNITDRPNIVNNGNYTNVTINAIAATDRYHEVVGGDYNQSAFGYPYVRLLHDEADLFSTYFYYDKLGRLIISQNSKQKAKTNPAFSYTLYDVLGRIVEVGEKAENPTVGNHIQFQDIFGTLINNYYNLVAIDDNEFQLWINDNVGTRTEVTHTFYDEQQVTILPASILNQQNLRKRVATTAFYDNVNNNPSSLLNYVNATHYSYDIHGNVNVLLQDYLHVTGIPASSQYKRIDYDYDLISGKVNRVTYQRNNQDQFFHQYTYDADNRITNVVTSKDSVIWDNDASYFYYAHGPLARTELGNNTVQGMDYVYTLQGWIKGVNSNSLKTSRDVGKDGDQTPSGGNPHFNFAPDAVGYTLGYFAKDYTPIDQSILPGDLFAAGTTASDLNAARLDLHNGNISSMVTSITKPTTYASYNANPLPPVLPLGSAYYYDQLNRISEAKSFDNFNYGTNNWQGGSTSYSGMYNNQFTYDANGNILTQLRKDQNGATIDNLSYNYNTILAGTVTHRRQNRLYLVNETIGNAAYADDIDNQGIFNPTLATINDYNNYHYDKIGNLTGDNTAEINPLNGGGINWTVYGKIQSLTRDASSTKDRLSFVYDASGNRIAKYSFNNNNFTAGHFKKANYYVRDAQGNVMATYELNKTGVGNQVMFSLAEKDIYGSSRLGLEKTKINLNGTPALLSTIDTSNHYTGNRQYELTNHLGNVLSVVSDKKIPNQSNVTASWIFDDGNLTNQTPNLAATSTVSVSGPGPIKYKIQPQAILGGVNFFFPTVIGQAYQINFDILYGTTVAADNLTAEAFDVPGNTNFTIVNIPNTQHYVINYTAISNTSGFKIFYNAAPSTLTDNFLIDNLIVTGQSTVSYLADIISSTDYSAFGAPMPGRTFNSLNYKYGFNGKEKDDETYGGGNEYDFSNRIYDSRLGRFLSVDQLSKTYPQMSPYCFAANQPTGLIDEEGDGPKPPQNNTRPYYRPLVRPVNWVETQQRVTNSNNRTKPNNVPYEEINPPPYGFTPNAEAWKEGNSKFPYTHQVRGANNSLEFEFTPIRALTAAGKLAKSLGLGQYKEVTQKFETSGFNPYTGATFNSTLTKTTIYIAIPEEIQKLQTSYDKKVNQQAMGKLSETEFQKLPLAEQDIRITGAKLFTGKSPIDLFKKAAKENYDAKQNPPNTYADKQPTTVTTYH